MNALENLLREKDFDEIGVGEIAAKAGVSPASVYRRFDKKQGFIPVLFELYLKRLSEWGMSPQAQLTLEGCTLREALQKMAHIAWQQVTQQTHILRAIHLHGRRHLDLLGLAGDQFESAMLDAMKAILGLYKADIVRKDHDTAARMLAYYFNSIFLERGLFKDQSGDWAKTIEDTDFTNEVADFAYGYLMTEK